ncbi:hypothetical protein B0T10DRAFT_555034 [Thelonectria olida]|uniref:Uncharacterized protein n=1 Tax=Thelonectria olida TaxID=1576542 RepID=A0A9P9AWI8_9HYPO|nr:hypothetical protein B0T10DRAFT_555034 [Thelonectria olida]
MVLKRKRSVTEMSSASSSPSSGSSFNSPHSVSGIINPFATIDLSPIHIHSRTLKRFRNSRPSEQEVHQRTLNMLYSAQHQQHMEVMTAPEQHQPAQQPIRPDTNQQSLHRFWNISSTPSTSQSVISHPTTPSSCADCGAGFTDGSGDQMMDTDSLAHACGACGKHVCFSCSVSNLGEQRRCLQCAGRKVRVAGVGWTTPGVPIC